MGFYPLRDHEEFVHDVSSYVPRSDDIKGALCTSRTVTDKLLKKNGSTLGTETKAFYRMVSKGYIKLNETREKGKCQKSEDTIITDLLSAFHVFDIQKKGYIESRDLREALSLIETDIPSKELQQMFKEIGLLSDRKITFAEFCSLVTDRSDVF
ncbi:uncharacterized protein LOC110042485 [Orbicella faveolata]|uniref:uncharacterized protein LOC110042485 n=1 Tax=Orbicella faveolata TaxID=48498 RepID=UPI0009E65CA3|nr:uncharacterized protein LOC110042485 [Orbicella faveolata]